MEPVDTIAVQGDEEEARQHYPMARKLLQTLRRRTEGSGVTTASTQLRLSNTAFAYALIGPGISRVVIVAGYDPVTLVASPLETDSIPDFWSGVMIGGDLLADRATAFWPTADTVTRYELPSEPHATRRLGVGPWNPVAQRWRFGGGSQYRTAVPTMWSGTMRKLCQFLLGFGKPWPTVHKKTVLERDLDPAALPFERQSSTGRQVRFDWAFWRTHGLTKGADGKWWMIEVGVQSGVIAMPLFIHPGSDQERFIEHLQRRGDQDALDCVELFNGFPTGEPFPTDSEALELARTSGLLVELASPEQLTEFYTHSSYSSSMGWAFTDSGREAHNTAWKYDDASRLQKGVWYQIRITIPAASLEPVSAAGAEIIAKLSRVIETKREAVKSWALRKAHRLSSDQVRQVLSQRSAEAAYDVFKEAQCIKVHNGSAAVTQREWGWLFWGSEFAPWIQFPSVEVGYCISHIMKAQFGRPRFFPRCDTVMHVITRGEAVEWVRYFFDPRQPPPSRTNTSTAEECMYEGRWEWRVENGAYNVPPQMYTSSFDERKEVGEHSEHTERTGRSLGYTSAQFGDDFPNPSQGTFRRTKTYLVDMRSQRWTGRFDMSTVRVPMYDRCAYYFAHGNGAQEHRDLTQRFYLGLTDPNGYRYWRNFRGWTPYAGNQPRGEHPAGCGIVTRRTVNFPITVADGPCNYLADAGPWSSVCADVESAAYNITLPTLVNPPIKRRIDFVDMYVMLVNASDLSPIETDRASIDNNSDRWKDWTRTSPDPETFQTQVINSTCNALGSSSCTQYDVRMNPDPDADIRVRGGPQHPRMTRERITFIGVFNG